MNILIFGFGMQNFILFLQLLSSVSGPAVVVEPTHVVLTTKSLKEIGGNALAHLVYEVTKFGKAFLSNLHFCRLHPPQR